MASERASQQAFFGVSALLFAASATLTIVWCGSMSSMGEMSMPGGWTMSMAWMRMPGQTWSGTAASFVGMWVVMMVAMMLPSLVPMLWRYRQAVARNGHERPRNQRPGTAPGSTATVCAHVTIGETWLGRLSEVSLGRQSETRPGRLSQMRLGLLTALVGVGYFLVSTAVGMAAFLLGVALATVEMQYPGLARVVPIAVGGVVLIAGALQFTAWKARYLACCRDVPGCGRRLPSDAGTAWRHGLRLGLHCNYCCAGLTTVLLVVGVMDLRAMAVVAAAITIERFAPAGERVARAIGAVVVGAGLLLIVRAVGLG
jgi:predicted metal-binding membrane protein